MNVYDFDDTIYDGDCTLDFYRFCIVKNPLLLRYLPWQCLFFVIYLSGWGDKTRFKQEFFCFLRGISDIEQYLSKFCQCNRHKIKAWYLNQQKENDIIISASPEFLIRPLCNELGIVHVLGSVVDRRTGQFNGENCYGSEKVARFQHCFQNERIDEFYSDSLSDAPLAALAQKSYIVSNNTITDWGKYVPTFKQKLKQLFASKEFFIFLIVGTINVINGVVFAFLYSFVMNVNTAFAIGYVTSLTISYYLNSIFTFKSSLTWSKYVKFCMSYIPNFIIQNVFVIIFYNIFDLDKLLTYCLAAILGVPVTFIMMKVFVFK